MLYISDKQNKVKKIKCVKSERKQFHTSILAIDIQDKVVAENVYGFDGRDHLEFSICLEDGRYSNTLTDLYIYWKNCCDIYAYPILKLILNRKPVAKQVFDAVTQDWVDLHIDENELIAYNALELVVKELVSDYLVFTGDKEMLEAKTEQLSELKNQLKK